MAHKHLSNYGTVIAQRVMMPNPPRIRMNSSNKRGRTPTTLNMTRGHSECVPSTRCRHARKDDEGLKAGSDEAVSGRKRVKIIAETDAAASP